MKDFGFTVNINKNSNILISHSEVNWDALKNGDLINIDNDKYFYTIIDKEEIFFIQSFENLNGKDILINGQYEYLFQDNDIIDISYKEYELLTIKNIINQGSGYKIGDLLNIDGGILSTNIQDNISKSIILKVENIDSNGGINKLSIVDRGIYIEFPDNQSKLKGGNGINAEILIEGKTIENRSIIERQVDSVSESNGNTIITLNYTLPQNIKIGKIAVEKYKAYLDKNYIGENKRSVDYHIIRDITPLGLPIVSKNSNKFEEAYNYSIKEIDKKFTDIFERLQKLENK